MQVVKSVGLVVRSKQISIHFKYLIMTISMQQTILSSAAAIAGKLADNFLWVISHIRVLLSAVLLSLSSKLCRYSS